MAVRSSSTQRMGPQLGPEFEDFGAPNWEVINCEFGDGHFAATKSKVDGPSCEVMAVKRRTDEKLTSEFEFEGTKSQP